MDVEVSYRPFGTMARLLLEANESVNIEPGAMIGMSANVDMRSGVKGGLLKGVKRMFGGENFFQNTYTANHEVGDVLISQRLPGDITVLDVPQHNLRLVSSAYIAGHRDVEIITRFSGFKGMFSGAGLFTMEAKASGPQQQIVVGAYGGITEMECDGTIVIDSGHLVAWDANLEYSIRKGGSGWIQSFLSGEGLVVRFRGEGRIWMQSRNAASFGRLLGPKLPPV